MITILNLIKRPHTAEGAYETLKNLTKDNPNLVIRYINPDGTPVMGLRGAIEFSGGESYESTKWE